MHIVLGLLGAIVTILYLLDRLGIDLGGLNPFYWYRRRAFAKKFSADPIYSIEDPVHIASMFVIGAAKLGGDLIAAQKTVARDQFETNFSMDSCADCEMTSAQREFIGGVQSRFVQEETQTGTWA